MIPLSKPKIGRNAYRYVKQALDKGDISRGPLVKDFEDKFAKFVGFDHASAVSSGTMALYVALRSFGVGKGDEVIVPTLTFAATADAVILTGATPVFCDVDPVTWMLSKATVEPWITKKTKAIIAVDLYGMVCDISTLRGFDLPIVRDACESLGADLHQGGDALITCFSFFGNKVMTTGEGGMACTDSKPLKTRMDELRNHGRMSGFFHEKQGVNARMPNVNAAIGISQLEDLPANLTKRRKVASWYGIPSINAPWLAFMRIKDVPGAIRRLKRIGIESRQGFTPLHDMPAYYQPRKLHNASKISEEVIILPLYPELTKQQVCKILSVL